MEFKDTELYGFFRKEFNAFCNHEGIYALVPARNSKGRECALICLLRENSDHTVSYVPVARLIDPAYRESYVLPEIAAA